MGAHPGKVVEGPAAEHALCWIKVDGLARAMLDHQQMVLWSNDAAELLFTGRHGIEVRGGVLCPSDPVRTEQFLGFLHSCGSGPATWSVKQPKRDGWLLLRGHCLDSKAKVVGICFTDTTAEKRVAYEQLDVAFGLTRSEHRVLLDLLGGNDAESLASSHGLSLDTIRCHIRHVYSKLGVRSREGLFARVQNFRN